MAHTLPKSEDFSWAIVYNAQLLSVCGYSPVISHATALIINTFRATNTHGYTLYIWLYI